LQKGAFIGEEAVRIQLVILVRFLRAAELPAKWASRLAFQGLRLYLLLCRSSHVRRQYAVLKSAFVEEERRIVAFLLSLTPPAQRSCTLLRGMSQDVQSWLLWQAQAALRPSSDAPSQRLPAVASTVPRPLPPGPPPARRQQRLPSSSSALGLAAPTSAVTSTPVAATTTPVEDAERRDYSSSTPPQFHVGTPSKSSTAGSSSRQRRSRGEGRTARGGGAEGSLSASKASSPSSLPQRDDLQSSVTHGSGWPSSTAALQEEMPTLQLFSSGEAVWLIHALLVFALVVVLTAMWRSLTPETTGVGEPYRVDL